MRCEWSEAWVKGCSEWGVWSPPTSGWLKLNVDVAFHPDKLNVGLGGVIQDD